MDKKRSENNLTMDAWQRIFSKRKYKDEAKDMKCSQFKGDRSLHDNGARKSFQNKLFVDNLKNQKCLANKVTHETILTGKPLDSLELSNDRDREMDCKRIEKQFLKKQFMFYKRFEFYESKFAYYQYLFICKRAILPPFNDITHDFMYRIRFDQKKIQSAKDEVFKFNSLLSVKLDEALWKEIKNLLIEFMWYALRRLDLCVQLPEHQHIGVELQQWLWFLFNVTYNYSTTTYKY